MLTKNNYRNINILAQFLYKLNRTNYDKFDITIQYGTTENIELGKLLDVLPDAKIIDPIKDNVSACGVEFVPLALDLTVGDIKYLGCSTWEELLFETCGITNGLAAIYIFDQYYKEFDTSKDVALRLMHYAKCDYTHPKVKNDDIAKHAISLGCLNDDIIQKTGEYSNYPEMMNSVERKYF